MYGFLYGWVQKSFGHPENEAWCKKMFRINNFENISFSLTLPDFEDLQKNICKNNCRSLPGWDKAWDECVDQLGSPAVVINIAGVKGEEDWEQTYDVNIVSIVYYIFF